MGGFTVFEINSLHASLECTRNAFTSRQPRISSALAIAVKKKKVATHVVCTACLPAQSVVHPRKTYEYTFCYFVFAGKLTMMLSWISK